MKEIEEREGKAYLQKRCSFRQINNIALQYAGDDSLTHCILEHINLCVGAAVPQKAVG